MAAASDLAESLGAENLYDFFGVEKDCTDKEVCIFMLFNAIFNGVIDKVTADNFEKFVIFLVIFST